MTDIEIARAAEKHKIIEIAKNIALDEDDLELFGNFKAKISQSAITRIKNSDRRNGKLILVTAVNPTPLGEGKTTLTIGLGQGLAKLGKKAILALREPSLGPCFGIKGGATGGGYSQVLPMEDINLHFNGDIHAVTTAHNLIAALIDNHISFGNGLNIKTVIWKRALDLNDRALRSIVVGVGENSGTIREDGFMITAASEIMALLCLSEDILDLKDRLSRIILGYDTAGKYVTLGQLGAVGSVAALLREAIRPNLVQTMEGVPAIIHGGPFANIAHGCSSVIATKIALKLADYVITEAGFGADLGAEKFFDIKCRMAGLTPAAVVLVATCRSLKYNGGIAKKDLTLENREALKIGVSNLVRHIENLKKYNIPIVVALNKFDFDTVGEIEIIENTCRDLGVKFSPCEAWARGGDGTRDLAEITVDLVENHRNNFTFLYGLDLSLVDKIEIIAKEIYRAEKVVFSDRAFRKLKQYTESGFAGFPICMAKTQYSFSDRPDLLGAPEDFTFTVSDVVLSAGAGFIVSLAGDIMVMPGLPKVPNANGIDVDENGEIVGLL
jgi:formate--tetrahydrofolate ligase